MKRMLFGIAACVLLLNACTSQKITVTHTVVASPEAPMETAAPQTTQPAPVRPETTFTPAPTQNAIQEFTLQTEGAELTFAFDMTMDEAKTQLKHAGIMYIEDDDRSYYRNWSGRRLKTDDFSLVFDMRGRLHEINIFGMLKTSLPAAVAEPVIDVQNRLGEAAKLDYPDEPTGLVNIEYCEYNMGGWHLRTVFSGECAPEDQQVMQVTAAKYSAIEYANNGQAAGLTVENTKGEGATLFIGMTHDDAAAALDNLGVAWRESGDDLISLNISYSADADGDGDPDEDDFIELYLQIYFDLAGRADQIDTYGAGARTAEGLTMGNSTDDMTALYGEGYTILPRELMHIYQYVYGDNYLCVAIDDITDDICVLSLSRYAGS